MSQYGREAAPWPLVLYFASLIVSSCRNDEDTESWWMSGSRECMFFYRIYKGSHGDVRLGKVPGDLLEDRRWRWQ